MNLVGGMITKAPDIVSGLGDIGGWIGDLFGGSSLDGEGGAIADLFTGG